jgi:hypothetical protein
VVALQGASFERAGRGIFMADGYWVAEIKSREVIIHRDKKISIEQAEARIRKGLDVYTTKKNARNLSARLGGGKHNKKGSTSWKDKAHGSGEYSHYHDANKEFKGHIIYGEPK